MINASIRVISLALLFTTSTSISANVWVQTNLGPHGNSPNFRTYDSRTDPSVDGNVTAQNRFTEQYPLIGESYAFVDAASGILKAKALSDLTLDPLYGYVGVSQAAATISETFSFQNFNTGQFSTLKYSFHGKLGLGPIGVSSSDDAYGYLNIIVTNAFNAKVMKTMCIGGSLFGNTCQGTGEIFNDGAFQIPIYSGDYKIEITLYAQSVKGNKVELNNTARLFLELPSGVTITSDSGSFLANASPVPEPQTNAYFIFGLLVIVGKRRWFQAICKSHVGRSHSLLCSK